MLRDGVHVPEGTTIIVSCRGYQGPDAGRVAAAENIAAKARKLREFLEKHPVPGETSDLREWHKFLNPIKGIAGNANNDVSFVATLIAKEYLQKRHDGVSFDASAKSQSEPGLDIDVRSSDGKRIVAEIKTLYPYHETDFDSAQRDSFIEDFNKLAKATAASKYLLVAEPAAYSVIVKRYRDRVRGIVVVSLVDGREFQG